MTELNHSSYEKISGNFSKYKLTEADYRLFKKTDWIVTEKIHGANFCIISDGETVNFAKRKEILSLEDDFFGYQIIAEDLKNKALAVFEAVKSIYPHTNQISIYGELFGGEYPHPEIKENPEVNAIQTGVYYSPNIEFMAFDLAYTSDRHERNYLDIDRFISVCEAVDLAYIPVLFRGKYEEAIAYKIQFTTTIPQLLNLPPLESENLAEGIVIKPAKNFFIETKKGKLRPASKIKIPQFAEDKRFHQAQKWNYSDYENTKRSPESSDRNIEIEAANLITLNRLDNLISKIGKPIKKKKKQRERILQLYVDDVIEDLEDNLNITFADLEKSDRQTTLALIKQQVGKLIGDR